MNHPVCWITALIFAGLSQVGWANQHPLATEGKTAYVIVTPVEPSSEENTAAEWLAATLHEVTGTTFAIKSETATDLPPEQLLVGDTRAARAAGIVPRQLESEAWRIQSAGPAILLAGGRPRGTIYAVCEFLDEHIGVLRLDPFTAVVPAQRTLSLKAIDRAGQPAFPWRLMYTGFPYKHPAGGGPLIEQFVIGNKNNINGRVSSGDHARFVPEGVHTFGYFISSKEFATSHPEYFGMDSEGKRVTDDQGSPQMWTQICATNPDVRRITVERARQFLLDEDAAAKREGRAPSRLLTLSQNDNTLNLCRCPECTAVADREGSESGPLLEYVNHVARALKVEFPDVRVLTEAYNFTLDAPRTIRPEANVIVRFCDNYGFSDPTRPLADPRNARPMKLFNGWRQKNCALGVWDYWRVFQQHPAGMFAPSSNVRALREDLLMFRAAGAQLTTIECEDLFGAGINNDPTSADLASFMPLRTWVGMKLLDAPDKDLDRLLDTFCRGYYGPGAKPMRDLLQLIEDRQAALPIRVVDVQRHVWLEHFCDAGFLASAYRLLDAAMAATATDSAAQTHVRRERIVIDSAMLWLDQHVRQSAPQVAGTFPTRAEILKRHREDWRAYLTTVFDSEGLKLAWPVIEQGLALAEKLNPAETSYYKTAAPTKESAIRLDGQLDEPHWSKAPVVRLLPRDPAAVHDDPTAIRLAWTDEALYVGIEQPTDQASSSLGITLSDADRKAIQLTLYVTQGDGPRPLGAYFYGFDPQGSLQVLQGRKPQSECVGSVTAAKTVTELRFRWSDIEQSPAPGGEQRSAAGMVINIDSFPKADSKAATHATSPWLIGAQPGWHSGYYSHLKLANAGTGR